MNKKNLYFLFFIFFILQACDKVEPPFGGSDPGHASSNSVTINNGTITGSIIDYSVTSATESDTSILYADWIYQTNGDTAFASVIFTWHDMKSDSLIGRVTPKGSVHFDDTLAIAAGSPFGTLAFHFIADIVSSGSGNAKVIVIIVNAQVVRKVLLMDFTGHHCMYCPHGAHEAAILEDHYGEQLITIAVHAGSFAGTNWSYPLYSYDFRTPEGTELNADYNSFGAYPSGMINLTSFNGKVVFNYPDWASKISNQLQLIPDANIKVTNTYNSSSREINTTVKSDFLNTLTGNYNLVVYLIEDSIINYQYIDTIPYDIPNYVHMHVLRTSYSGTYGEMIASNPDANNSITKNYYLTLNNDFNENHCYVVAFVFKNSGLGNKQVIQAEKQKLIP